MNKLCAIVAILILSKAASANSIKYPERAERLRIDGEVTVLYDVNAQGRTENIRVISAQPQYVFSRSVKKQIAQWKYPAGHKETDIPLRVIFTSN